MPDTVLVDLTPLATPTKLRGIGRYLRTLATGLSRLSPAETGGLRLLALTRLTLDGRFTVSEDLAGATLEIGSARPSQLDRYRWAYARRVALWNAARRTGARLVHLGDPNSTPLGMGWSRCRRVVTCHDLIPFQFPEIYLGVRDGFGVVGKALIKRRFRSADRVIAISQATRRELVRLLGVEDARIDVAYNGVDLASFHDGEDDVQATLAEQGLTRAGYVLYVGDTDWRKNVEGMVGAVARSRARGHGVQLAFAGKLEARKVARIREQARSAGIEAALTFLGYVPDRQLQALYRGALAHLFVSRFEGFGYTVVEAMAAGCPVVTTHCGSLAEVAGDAAVLVDPDDEVAMADALDRLRDDPVFRRTTVERGHTRARTFTCEQQARSTVQSYRRVLEADGAQETGRV